MRKKGEIEHKEQNEDPMGKLETGRKDHNPTVSGGKPHRTTTYS